MTQKSCTFKTEVQQLLDLVIHSLYSKKEIFLRELISNASDAIDRLQFEALTNPDMMPAGESARIKIMVDKAARTLTLIDNGIGMTSEEVETNIGTIANSGTRKFLDELKKQKSSTHPEFIGQFGVGFYASFMVADKVTVLTRRAGSTAPAVFWTSTGTDTYTIEEGTKASHGTEVTLHLREDMDSYLEEYEIRHIIREYSNYISHPVLMDITRTKKAEKEGDPEITEVTEETLNSRKAIWKAAKGEVTDTEYNDFYKHLTHDYSDPSRIITFSAEGATEFKALLFIPSAAPMDLNWQEGKRGLHLYVKNVLIKDNCEELLPPYLRFVKGVVDSSDLPLNVSREMLQDDAIIHRIKKSLINRILKELDELKTKAFEEYRTFHANFGPVIKEGVYSDFENGDKLRELILFPSSRSEAGQPISLRQYVDRMPAAQKEIYYLAAASLAQATHSPHLEMLARKNYEVLFFVEPVDEWVAQRLTDYDKKKLKAIDRGDLDIHSEDEKKEQDAALKGDETRYKDLLAHLQTKLSEEVKAVKLSTRLTDSSCCLVADEMGMNANMERIMRAMNQKVPAVKRILELNPQHPIMPRMLAVFEKDKDSQKLADYAELLFDQALLTEGSAIKDPLRFSRLVSSMMVDGL